MIGKTISHYRIIEKLGQGGMGVVYKAHDTKLDRFVALKFLPPHLTQSDTDKARFLQEARAAAALNHPNVCVIYEIEEEGDHPFIAMEFIDGTTLKHKLQDAPIELKTVIEYAIQIAGALQTAHEKGIVHRDVKSENIMITETGQVKVMDFGLAKIRGAAQLTRTSSTIGTVAYMSPEYIQGRDTDARADIFSFGVVFYEMLTGHFPFSGEYESAMMYAILNEEPEPVQKYRPDVSSEILHVLNRALEKDPEERYQSANDMLIDLKRLKRDADRSPLKIPAAIQSEVKFPPAQPNEKQEHLQPDKQKGIVTKIPLLVVIVLVIFITAAGVLYFLPDRIEKGYAPAQTAWKNSIAVLPFDDASPDKDQKYFCDGMTEEVITHLARNHELKVISKTSVDYFKDSDQSLQNIGKQLDVNNILEGSIRKQGDMIRVTARLIDLENEATIWTDSFDRELKNIFEVQEEIARAISEALKIRFVPHANDAPAMNPEVYKYWLQARDAITNYTLSGQVKDFEQSVALANKALEIDPENALIYASLGWIYNIRYSLTGDLTYRKPVVQYCIRAYQLNPDLGHTNIAMAFALYTQDQYDRAAHHMQRALILEPNNAEINHTVGLLLYWSGMENKAIDYFKKAAEINPFLLFTPSMLSNAYRNCGRFAEAETVLRNALNLSLSNPILNVELAEILILNNRADEAAPYLERAAGSPFVKNLRGLTALLHAVRGGKNEALSIEDIDLNGKGLLYAFLGMKEEALTSLESGSETSYLLLINHPFYDSLRKEKRYQAVLKKLKEQYEHMNSIFEDL